VDGGLCLLDLQTEFHSPHDRIRPRSTQFLLRRSTLRHLFCSRPKAFRSSIWT
jgi:hypothetical protein